MGDRRMNTDNININLTIDEIKLIHNALNNYYDPINEKDAEIFYKMIHDVNNIILKQEFPFLNNLTPCKFCSYDHKLDLNIINNSIYQIKCNFCKCSGPEGINELDAATKWGLKD